MDNGEIVSACGFTVEEAVTVAQASGRVALAIKTHEEAMILAFELNLEQISLLRNCLDEAEKILLHQTGQC